MSILDCGPGLAVEKPFWECAPSTPEGDICKRPECKRVNTNYGVPGGVTPEGAEDNLTFEQAPDPDRFYWDYKKNGKGGWGRQWVGRGIPECVKCMLRNKNLGYRLVS